MPRDYKKEYANYQGKPGQVKKRASRNAARSAMALGGKVKKGDGKDVHHKDGNPRNNAKSNLRVQSASTNRSFPRKKNATKK
jgi:hypothetical protein|tara:strand:+ start:368 stop:613 length:246 start_codon:yes stop_codon:yes gene_type:complete